MTEPAATTRTLEHTYVMQTYARPDMVVERGEGVYLYDTDGRPYLDFVAGIGVNALGYGDAEVIQTITEQATRLVHVSNLYHTRPGPELARLLVEQTPGCERVFFANSGAEAVEGAIKMARKFARTHASEEKTVVVACEGSFHGRTMGAVALTAREKYRLPFMPVMPDVRFIPFNTTDGLEQAIGDDVCAVIVEPVQGEGGINVANTPFLQALRARCDACGALLIFDEIQCGMGRTGRLWAHQHTDVTPDILTSAKPLGGGLPIGAILASQRVADVLSVGDHGTTFGGGPLVTAVAQVVLRRVSDPAFLHHVQTVSAYLDEGLQQLAADFPTLVREVRGRGLMRGIAINAPAGNVRQRCYEAGLLVATAGEDVIRLLPPLIIEPVHVDEALQKLRTSVT